MVGAIGLARVRLESDATSVLFLSGGWETLCNYMPKDHLRGVDVLVISAYQASPRQRFVAHGDRDRDRERLLLPVRAENAF